MALPDIWRGDRASPLRDMSRLQRQIDRVFEDFFSPLGRGTELSLPEEGRFVPAVDIEETDKNYLLCFDMPGLSKDDIRIEMDENRLTVSGERRDERESKEKGLHRQERYYGSFQRSFVLPDMADSENVEATFQDGVLRVSVPKSEKSSKSRRIEISEGASGQSGQVGQKKKDEKGAA